MTEIPQTISAQKLCSLSGLSDQRHRQLAKAGYFPPPVRAQYRMTPTIRGLFDYYQKSYQRSRRNLDTLRAGKLERETRKLDLEIAEREATSMDVAEVGDLLHHLASFSKTILYQRLGREFGARCAGKSPEELTGFGNGIADEICGQLAEAVTKWSEDREERAAKAGQPESGAKAGLTIT